MDIFVFKGFMLMCDFVTSVIVDLVSEYDRL